MEFELEKYKIFPYAAWGIFIGFALFVGNLSLELYQVTNELAEASVHVEKMARDNAARLESVEDRLNDIGVQ